MIILWETERRRVGKDAISVGLEFNLRLPFGPAAEWWLAGAGATLVRPSGKKRRAKREASLTTGVRFSLAFSQARAAD